MPVQNSLKQRKLPILILVEGETEEKYFQSLRSDLLLSMLFIEKGKHTDAPSLIDEAESLFRKGKTANAKTSRASQKTYPPKYFSKVFIVFDMDEKLQSYNLAMQKTAELNKLKLKTARHSKSNREYVEFKAIPSIPNFELWVLLHFESISVHQMSISMSQSRLRKFIPDYRKGDPELYEAIKENTAAAIGRAKRLSSCSIEKMAFRRLVWVCSSGATAA